MPYHIVISGASSVGKSTLAHELLKKFSYDHKKYNRFIHIEEVARNVMQNMHITRQDLQSYICNKNQQLFVNFQDRIIYEQLKKFDENIQQNYISDRSAFDALAFIDSYFNEESAMNIFKKKEFNQRIIQHSQKSYMFLVLPQQTLPATNDNVRLVSTYEEQQQFTELLKKWFNYAKLPYFIITELELKKRIEFVRNVINGHFIYYPEISLPLNLPFQLETHHIQHSQSVVPLFHVEKAPSTDQSFIRYITILNKDEIKISYKLYEKNRFIEKYDHNCKNNKFIILAFEKSVDKLLIENILLNDIIINGVNYYFVGCSNSQLRGGACYIYQGTREEIERMILDNGDFDKIINLSKRLARIGLLFSSGTPTVEISQGKVEEIDDVEKNGYCFTDGCGIIGKSLMRKILSSVGIKDDYDNETVKNRPCALQIRFQGCKGKSIVNFVWHQQKSYQ
ncbi:unnamed protein product [Didymodactylos carnosus]|uniref:RNA-dependent RNA polymerase n=1 Tax=Didymodactylos carnosus TaxID=1234261 RepID=A0A814P9B8_9BILA|nr:unnamed protein product [Didymodactylos carnosus]CAF3867081.1 unnamed protein product [Didymodactylos carnosus]